MQFHERCRHSEAISNYDCIKNAPDANKNSVEGHSMSAYRHRMCETREIEIDFEWVKYDYCAIGLSNGADCDTG